MKMRQLGQGGPMVSAIGLGCWNITGAYGETNEEESRATLSKALDLGVDFCLLYTSPSPRDRQKSRMPSSA